MNSTEDVGGAGSVKPANFAARSNLVAKLAGFLAAAAAFGGAVRFMVAAQCKRTKKEACKNEDDWLTVQTFCVLTDILSHLPPYLCVHRDT